MSHTTVLFGVLSNGLSKGLSCSAQSKLQFDLVASWCGVEREQVNQVGVYNVGPGNTRGVCSLPAMIIVMGCVDVCSRRDLLQQE